MSRAIPSFIVRAYQFGLLMKGWCLQDYVMDAAVRPDGFEVIVVDGVQRSGKSNETLQIASWAKLATFCWVLNNITLDQYNEAKENGVAPMDFFKALPKQPEETEIWDAVLKAICFKAADFVQYLEAVPDGEPTDVAVWDDIAGHYSNMSFRIDPEEYARVDGAFTVLGTKARIIVTNIPNLTRLSKNVKDHLSFEIFIGRNKLRKIIRLFRLPGRKHVDMELFKVEVEESSKFDIYVIPFWAWTLYETQRIDLAKEVFKSLGETVDMDKPPEGYISIFEAVKLARDNGLRWGISTIQQNASRGICKKVTAGGYMFIELESLNRMVTAETYKSTPKTRLLRQQQQGTTNQTMIPENDS